MLIRKGSGILTTVLDSTFFGEYVGVVVLCVDFPKLMKAKPQCISELGTNMFGKLPSD